MARVTSALIVTFCVALTACGAGSAETNTTGAPATAGTPTPVTEAAPGETPPVAATDDVGSSASTGPATAEEPPASAPTDPQAADDNAVDPPATEPAGEPEEVPVIVAALGGRALGEELSSAADIETNVLPDLVVDDVGRDAKVNLRNVFPADRPVLLWLWAPH